MPTELSVSFTLTRYPGDFSKKGLTLAIYDIFSKRQKKLRGEEPDVYSYTDLPRPLRVQIVRNWSETLGDESQGRSAWRTYKFIVDALRREYGLFHLPGTDTHREGLYIAELTNFFLQERDVEKALDVVELTFRAIDRITKDVKYLDRKDASTRADAAIEELNLRFKEHGVGYQYVDGDIIRVDSELLHADVVKPALVLLKQEYYAGAQQEFLSAHEHYRLGNAKEALNECLKAFESTMKAICDKRGWGYSGTDTSKNLIQACLDNGLIPSFWQQHYSSLRSLLESGIPTGRNKLGGHGQGTSPTTVPDYLVGYMLHMTASAIVFLAEAEKNLP